MRKWSMDIKAEKIELAKLLLEKENPNIIQSVKNIFRKNNTIDIWDELNAEQKDEIDNASIEIENEKVVDYDSFIQKHK